MASEWPEFEGLHRFDLHGDEAEIPPFKGPDPELAIIIGADEVVLSEAQYNQARRAITLQKAGEDLVKAVDKMHRPKCSCAACEDVTDAVAAYRRAAGGGA